MSTRFSTADAAWLHMDRPTNLMVINTVLLFDEPVDWERFKQLTQAQMVDVYPRFSQRAVESRLPLRPPKWVDDPDFALEHHMHHLALPAPGDTAALRELVSDLMTMPLDHGRPLWHTYMIDGVGEGAAIISRMHHCIADGVALAQVLLSLTDPEPDVDLGTSDGRPVAARSDGVLGDVVGPAIELLSDVARLASRAVRQGGRLIRTPSDAAMLAAAVGRDAGTAVRLLLTPADTATALKGNPGISRRVSWSEPLPLADVKRIAHSHGATVNDVLLAAVSGALRHYLQERGSPVGEIQAMVPFNLRRPDQPIPRTLGNKFGLVFVPLPVGTSGSHRRLVEVRRRMREIKTGRDGPVSYGMLSATGLTPEPIERLIIDLFTAKTTAVMTNVPGPREPVYVAGSPIRTAIVWAPTSGRMGMSVSIFSYRGEVTVGLMTDAALIPDPERISDSLTREVQSLAKTRPVRRRVAITKSSNLTPR
jgi:WS/DGAT/MGAT family acyltransferase